MRTHVRQNPANRSIELFTVIGEDEIMQRQVAQMVLDSAVQQAGKELAKRMVRTLKTNLCERRVKPFVKNR